MLSTCVLKYKVNKLRYLLRVGGNMISGELRDRNTAKYTIKSRDVVYLAQRENAKIAHPAGINS